MNRTFIYCAIQLLLVFAIGCQSAARNELADQTELAEFTPEEILEASSYIDAKPRKATRLLKKWIKKNPNHPAMDDALYYKGLSEEARGKSYDALYTYEKLTKNHGGSEHFFVVLEKQVDLARLYLGGKKRPALGGLLRFTAYEDSLEVLENVALRWPGSDLAGRALALRADFYFEKGRYEEAQQGYQLVIDNYQNSEFYEKALRNSAVATLQQYLGPRYDPTPLIEARTRFRRYMRQFPVAARQEDVPNILSRIDTMLAEKDYEIGDFYYRTHRHAQAIIYWQSVIEQWPDTTAAEKAQVRIRDLQSDS